MKERGTHGSETICPLEPLSFTHKVKLAQILIYILLIWLEVINTT